MQSIRIAAGVAIAALLVSATGVRAEDEGTKLADEAKEYINKFVDINALVATTYTWAHNNPPSNVPTAAGNVSLPYLAINKNNNTFSLYDGWFQVSRNRADEDFGFVFSMDFGQTAQYAGADWNGDGSTEGDFVEVREFYGIWKTGFQDITVKAGKFVSLLGYEILLTNTAYNPTVTLSYLFMNVPYTNTGLLAHMPLGEIATIDLAVVNGWDNVVDNNNQKSFMMGLGATPAEGLTMYLAGIYGAENCGQASSSCTALPPAGAGSHRGAVTLNATYTFPEETGLALAVDSLYANDSNVLPDPVTGQPFSAAASWYGAAGYIMWNIPVEELKGLFFNVRGEVINDPDGYRNPNGTVNPAVVGTPQTIYEFSPTLGYKISDNILTRFEYRFDSSDKFGFAKSQADTFSKTANTISAEVIVAF